MFSNMDLDISPIGAKSTNWWSGSSLEAFESVFMAFGFGEPLASADLLAMIRTIEDLLNHQTAGRTHSQGITLGSHRYHHKYIANGEEKSYHKGEAHDSTWRTANI